jgi:dienelactone hydrolase
VTPFDGPIGPAIMDNIKGQDMNIMNAKYEKVINHLAAQGAEKTFSIGFCWGVWYAFKLSAKYGKFIAIAGPHPSLQIE